MNSNTPKVIKSVKLNISHQMMPYSSVKTICGSSYTYFSIIGELGQVGGDWDQIRPIIGTTIEKIIHSVKLHISQQMKPYLSVNAI